MNKSLIIRGSVVMGIFLAIIGIAVGCSMIKKDAVEPQISNGDDVYLTLADFDLTKQELWEVMKNVGGLEHLTNYIDEIILADYILAITPAEVATEVELQTYLTDNAETIAEIKADADLDLEYVTAFRQTMIISGFNPDNADDLKSYVALAIAKTKMAKEYILNAGVDSSYELTAGDIEDYYNFSFYNDACALEVRFSSAAEANLVLDKFDLVPNYNLGFGAYEGVIDIELMPTDEFNFSNTRQLTDEEVFTAFVGLYNYMNPWMDQLPADITQEDYCANYSDISTFNYTEVISTSIDGDPKLALVNYLFQTLDLEDEETIPFSYDLQTIGDLSMLFYKVSEEPRTEFEDLTANVIIDLREELIDLYVSPAVINDIMTTKREEVGFEIFDPYLKLQYLFDNQIEFDNNGSKTVVATFGDLEITADDLYDYMEPRVGTFYSVEISKVKSIINSDAYVDLYGTSRDYMNNKSEEMIEHRDALRTMKATFGQNGYSTYGFSANDYTWEEFLFLAFGATSEHKAMEQVYIVGKLQPSMIYSTLNYGSVSDYIKTQIDDYFNLQVEHALIYVDFDKDFLPDSFDDMIASFDAAQLLEYNTLNVNFDYK